MIHHEIEWSMLLSFRVQIIMFAEFGTVTMFCVTE